MENSDSKTVLSKPILLKAGIPLAVSLGGLIYTMVTRKRQPPEVPSAETQVDYDVLCETDYQEEFQDKESFHSLDSRSLLAKEEEEEEEGQQITYNQVTISSERFLIRDGLDLEEELLSLKKWMMALQERETELEMKFIHYCSLKDQESIVMELQNTLTSEISRVKFLALEARIIEFEKQTLEAVGVEHLRIVEQLESARLENVLLQRKAKKLLRKNRKHSRLLRQQSSALQSREADILRNEKELESSSQVIKESEEEIIELRRMVVQLQEEKKELVHKLEEAESIASSTSKEKPQERESGDIDQLLTQLEQLHKDRAAEMEELIYLRWINACLRHELLRNQEQQITHQHDDEGGEPLELEFEEDEEKKDCGVQYDTNGSLTAVSKHHEWCLGITSGGDHPFSKRHRLLQKLKKWVDGSDKCKKLWDDKDKHLQIVKGTSSPSVSYVAIEEHPAARKSCSSV